MVSTSCGGKQVSTSWTNLIGYLTSVDRGNRASAPKTMESMVAGAFVLRINSSVEAWWDNLYLQYCVHPQLHKSLPHFTSTQITHHSPNSTYRHPLPLFLQSEQGELLRTVIGLDQGPPEAGENSVLWSNNILTHSYTFNCIPLCSLLILLQWIQDIWSTFPPGGKRG